MLIVRFRCICTLAVGLLGAVLPATAGDGVPLPAANPQRGAADPAPPPAGPFPVRNPARAATTQTNVQLQTSAPGDAPAFALAASPPVPQRAPDAPVPAFDYDKALAPILDYALSAADRDHLKEAIRATYSGRVDAANAAIAAIKNKAARKVAEWYFLRSDELGADPARIEAFRQANPDWPSLDVLRQRAEQALFVNRAPAKAIKSFFAKSPPASPAGKAALALAHVEADDQAKALPLLRAAWLAPNLNNDVERAILDRMGNMLTPSDHKARIDKLLYQDRASKIDEAMRVAKLLGDDEKKKVEARAAVVRRSKSADKLLDALPDAAKSEVGLQLSRIQWLRRNGREKDAWQLLKSVPGDPALLLDLDEWWIERRVNCRAALNDNEPALAYEIAKNHGPLSGDYYAEAEFLAGWIALRSLNQPADAKPHFIALRTAATDAETIARAEYWLGRTEQALGHGDQALAHYRNGARYGFEYYGQLAAQAALASAPAAALEVAPTAPPTDRELARLLGRDAVQAIGVLRTAGLENLAAYFFFALARTLDAPGEVVLLAELARRMELPQASVRLSKIALNRGLSVVDYAFPIDVLPFYTALNDGVEPALLHALSRQESEFNPAAKSPAGARGLLQLMPRTARNVARSYKVGFSAAKLTSEPAYNMMLGAAHLRDLVDEFGGSYAMALAAYNAGGPRVLGWADQFGDPRQPNMDVIDWVERIPFTETRRYVQKIMESLQVFRARLEGADDALRLVGDLERGKIGARSAAAD